MSEESDLEEVYLLSDYKIDDNDETMKLMIQKFYQFVEIKEYYMALYNLENLLLQDGTSQKYNYIFLKFIITNIYNLIKDIKKKKKEKDNIIFNIKNKEELDYLKDVDKYDFYYLRNCFDKYEIALNDEQLLELLNDKIIYNKSIIEKEAKSLNEKYSKFMSRFTLEGNFILPKEIYEIITNINNLIKNKDYKLFYLYKYLNYEDIQNNYIFECLENNYLYLNNFYFPAFDNLGIPIGYCNNIYIINRYLFSLLQNKIVSIEEDKKMEKINKKKAIELVFRTFKEIFKNIIESKMLYMKYFSFLFANVIFDVQRNILFTCQFNEIPLYFKILCNQFLDKDEIDKNYLEQFKSNKNCDISFDKLGYATIKIKDDVIKIKNKEYSINSFLYNFIKDSWSDGIEVIKNKAQRFLCKNKIYDSYFNEFIILLKKICISNVAEIMQSLHEDFKQYKTFYKNAKILQDLFNNRLKFYPFESKGLHGITDKYLMEIYLSSLYSQNSKNLFNHYFIEQPKILIIFNMSLNSVIFQHESLNHYIRAYLFYSYDQKNNLRKVSMNTKKNYCYYPQQKLNKIKVEPLYLKKFLVKMNSKELKELKKPSNLDFKQFLEETNEDKKDESDIEMSNDDNNINTNYIKNESSNKNNINYCSDDDDDEGYYYERQLFTDKGETKLKQFNFLQALMLLDEDAYNLDPVHFHYCFLKLKNANNYNLIKENFKSPLLNSLLENIDFSQGNDFKNMIFICKRSLNDELLFEFERDACDVMPSYIRTVGK